MVTSKGFRQFITVAGVGAVITAVLWAAPDTLDPPPGPVEGTGHTLEELYQKLDTLQNSVDDLSSSVSLLSSIPTFDTAIVNANGRTPILEEGGERTVILDSIHVYTGGVFINDRFGNTVARVSTTPLSNGSGQIIGSNEYTPRGLVVAAPLMVHSFSSTNNSTVTIGFYEAGP